MTELKTSDFTWFPPVIEPPSGLAEIRLNYWWITNKKGEICRFKNISYQSHPVYELADRLLVINPDGHELKRLPVVYLSHNCNDYF